MRSLRIAAFSLSLSIAACAGSGFEWDNVRLLKLGMSESEVTALLGPPTAVRSTENGVTWAWTHVNGLTATTRSVSVVFKDGRLASIPQVPTAFK